MSHSNQIINNDSDTLLNRTYTDDQPEVENIVVALGLVVILWAFIANSSIVACFIINRSKIWPSFSTQILSLSVSDMCVGVASLPLCLLPITNVDLSHRSCSVLFILFFASQCASLYHIFGICVHRFVIISKASRMREKRSDIKMSIILVISAWCISVLVCSFISVISGNQDSEIKHCLMEEIYKEKMSQVTGYLFVVYFVPQCLTTVLYFIACCRLKKAWKIVFPTNSVETVTNPTTARTAASLSNQANTNISDNAINRTSIRMQRNVIGTIGALMLIFNVCTIPIIVLFQMENQNQITKRDSRFIAAIFFILNSSLNPFVYALRTNWLKMALKQMFIDLFRTFCQCYTD